MVTSRRRREFRIHHALALCVIGIGVFGQLCDAAGVTGRINGFELHLSFGVALALCMTSRLAHELRANPPTGIPSDGGAPARPWTDMHCEPRAVNRRLKCWVYLLLYGLAGVRELANICVFLGHGGRFALGDWRVGLQWSSQVPLLPTLESFQVYVAYGIAALVLSHARAGRASLPRSVDSSSEVA